MLDSIWGQYMSTEDMHDDVLRQYKVAECQAALQMSGGIYLHTWTPARATYGGSQLVLRP